MYISDAQTCDNLFDPDYTALLVLGIGSSNYGYCPHNQWLLVFSLQLVIGDHITDTHLVFKWGATGACQLQFKSNFTFRLSFALHWYEWHSIITRKSIIITEGLRSHIYFCKTFLFIQNFELWGGRGWGIILTVRPVN